MTVSRREFLATAGAIMIAPGVFASINDEVTPMIEALKQAYSEGQKSVEETLKRLTSDPRDLLNRLGEPTKGGIRVLYNTSELTILNITWAPLMVLRPHDHNMWASIGVYEGREDNIFWKRSESAIEPVGAGSYGAGEVTSLDHDAIHSVVNPTPRLTAAIHVYGGDFFAPGRTSWAGKDQEPTPFSQEGLKNHFVKSNARFGL